MNFKHITYLGFVLLFVSCEDFFVQEIDTDFEEEMQPVVQLEFDFARRNNGLLYTLSEPTYNNPQSTSRPQYENIHADIELLTDNGNLIFHNTDIFDTIAVYNYVSLEPTPIPPANSICTLEIKDPERGNTNITQKVPAQPIYIRHRWAENDRYDPEYDQTFKELEIDVVTGGAQHFILGFGYREDNRELYRIFDINSSPLRTNQFTYETQLFMALDQSTDTATLTAELPVSLIENSDDNASLNLYLSSCSEDHYNVKLSVYERYLNEELPFVEPVFLYSNNPQGIGYFTIINSTRTERISFPN